MPYLDVNVALTNPFLYDKIIVLRRGEIVNWRGRSIVEATSIPTIAVVTPDSPANLEREPDKQYMRKTISVVTRFRIIGPAPGFQPDVIQWHNDNYLVVSLSDVSNFGAGFMEAICTSFDSLDEIPEG